MYATGSDQRRWRNLRFFATAMIILLNVSVILQVVGLSTRGWMIYKTTVVEIHSGLFEYEACALKVCVTNDTDNKAAEDAAASYIPGIPSFKTLQAETITALVFCVIAIVVLSVALCRRGWCRVGFIVACVTSCLSAILALVAAGQIARLTMLAHNNLDPSPFDFPYSVLLTGLGGIFAAICVMALIGILVSGYSLRDVSNNAPHAHKRDERVHYTRPKADHVYYKPQEAYPYGSPYHTPQHYPYYMYN